MCLKRKGTKKNTNIIFFTSKENPIFGDFIDISFFFLKNPKKRLFKKKQQQVKVSYRKHYVFAKKWASNRKYNKID